MRAHTKQPHLPPVALQLHELKHEIVLTQISHFTDGGKKKGHFEVNKYN